MMKQISDYFDHADFAATVCDKDGVVVYQNAVSRANDGSVVGRNLYRCHSAVSGDKIRHMLETGSSNTYEIVKKGKRFLIHHSPWTADEDSTVEGLIELSIPLPDTYPTFNRDRKQ